CGEPVCTSGFGDERGISKPSAGRLIEGCVGEPVPYVDATGGVPLGPCPDAGGGERTAHLVDDAAGAQEQVVDESERGDALLVPELGHLLDDVAWGAGADGDVGVGGHRGAAERAVVGAAA